MFGHFITLNYGFSPNPDRMEHAFAALRTLAVRGFRYEAQCGRLPRTELAFLWALEQRFGWPHVHWLVHLPASHEEWFWERLDGWILRTAGVCDPGFFHCRSADDLALPYLLKGCDPDDYEGPCQFRSSIGSQGLFHAKRVGVSLNIGPSARGRFRQGSSHKAPSV